MTPEIPNDRPPTTPNTEPASPTSHSAPGGDGCREARRRWHPTGDVHQFHMARGIPVMAIYYSYNWLIYGVIHSISIFMAMNISYKYF